MPLKTTAAQMVAEARGKITEIDTAELIARHADDPDLVIVDIRDVRERQRVGTVRGSFHVPGGMIEFWGGPDSPHHKEVFAQEGKKGVFRCDPG